MTFEEFFKKKKIDLDAFQQGNPALLSEFKKHFELMGEKSFDHTKKFWFNKLRLQFHLSPEVKTEKMKMENPLAEQTITDSLAESALSEPRSENTSKFQEPPISEQPDTGEKATTAAPKPGFTPRFKPGVTKPTAPTPPELEENAPAEPVADKPKGFTPRFKAGVTKTPPTTTTEETAPKPVEEQPAEAAQVAEKPKGFTPRFKAGVTKTPLTTSTEETAPKPVEEQPAETAPAAEKPKGFTPRFKAGVSKAASSTPEEESAPKPVEEKPIAEQPATESKPKIGFTPRFKAGITKTATPEEKKAPEDNDSLDNK